MANTHSAANLYQSVINDVIGSVRESFLDESVDENVLLELKNLWVQKLEASKAVEQPQVSNDAAALDSKMAGARSGYSRVGGGGGGGGGGATSHVVINDPNRLVPVQITIPAQQGNPSSQPRALTVPAQVLSLPPEHGAMYFTAQTNQAFRLGIFC